jgi:hypothetical protein
MQADRASNWWPAGTPADMANSQAPQPGERVTVHPPLAGRTETATAMPGGSVWITFERGENEPWDSSRMHSPAEAGSCGQCQLTI